jgi:hypothetical protein
MEVETERKTEGKREWEGDRRETEENRGKDIREDGREGIL